MKIAVYEVTGMGRQFFSSYLKNHTIIFTEKTLNTETAALARDADIIVTFIRSAVTKEVINMLKNVKLICTMSSGVDHIEIAYCREKGISVCHVPEYGRYTIAEFTIGLILALCRNIHTINDFSAFDDEKNLGTDLRGKTLGVVGVGRVGINVVKLAQALGMKVIGFDHFKKESWAHALGFDMVDLNTLYSQSDIITMHIPCDDTTRGMINAKSIALMKKGAIFINTARGGLADTDALIEALEIGHLAGAALDVFEYEAALAKGKAVEQHERLKKFRNVILTYHHAYKTDDSLQKMLQTTLDNINAFASGKPANLVH